MATSGDNVGPSWIGVGVGAMGCDTLLVVRVGTVGDGPREATGGRTGMLVTGTKRLFSPVPLFVPPAVSTVGAEGRRGRIRVCIYVFNFFFHV